MKKLIVIAGTIFLISSAIQADKNIQRIIFEEKQIEGKIRRPQLVLIKADQRPDFKPMVMQSLDTIVNVAEFGRSLVFEKSSYSGAFMFNSSGAIANYQP